MPVSLGRLQDLDNLEKDLQIGQLVHLLRLKVMACPPGKGRWFELEDSYLKKPSSDDRTYFSVNVGFYPDYTTTAGETAVVSDEGSEGRSHGCSWASSLPDSGFGYRLRLAGWRTGFGYMETY
jgi:hypothetical protein